MFVHCGESSRFKNLTEYILSSHASVQAKVEMLDNLLDIEVAYSLLRGGAQDNEHDPIDINYEKLKTKIEVESVSLTLQLKCCPLETEWNLSDVSQVVDKNTQEAEIIMQYVKNTHAATHNTYTLEVQEVSSYLRRKTVLCEFFE